MTQRQIGGESGNVSLTGITSSLKLICYPLALETAMGQMALSVSVMPALPKSRDAYDGGAWRSPKGGSYIGTMNPGTGGSLGGVADRGAADIDATVAAAESAFEEWKRVASSYAKGVDDELLPARAQAGKLIARDRVLHVSQTF